MFMYYSQPSYIFVTQLSKIMEHIGTTFISYILHYKTYYMSGDHFHVFIFHEKVKP